MTRDESTAAIVWGIIRRRASLPMERELSDDLALGGDGLGFDSVAIVETLLECEAACGVRLAPDIFDGTQITVGRLVAAIGNVRQ